MTVKIRFPKPRTYTSEFFGVEITKYDRGEVDGWKQQVKIKLKKKRENLLKRLPEDFTTDKHKEIIRHINTIDEVLEMLQA